VCSSDLLGVHLDGTLSLDEAVADIQRTTFAYARRQRTWFRKESATLRAETPPDAGALARAIAAWACDRTPDQAG